MPATAKTQTIGGQQVNTAEMTGLNYSGIYDALNNAKKVGEVNGGALSISDAGVPKTYYHKTTDSIEQVLSPGYFDSATELSDGDKILAEVAGESYELKLVGGVASVQSDLSNITGMTDANIFDYLSTAKRLQSTKPGATVQTLADAVTLAASDMAVGEIVTTREYNAGTGIGGNTYQLVDAGNSGARPAEDGGFVIHVGESGLYLQWGSKEFVPCSKFGVSGSSDSAAYTNLIASCDYIFNDISPDIEQKLFVNLDNKVITGKPFTSATIKRLIQATSANNCFFFKTGFESSVVNADEDTSGLFYAYNVGIEKLRFIDTSFTVPNANINAIKIINESSDITDGVTIDNCDFENIGRMGVEFQNHNDATPLERYKNVKVLNSRFKNIGTQQYGMCTSFSGIGSDITVANCEFSGHIGPAVESVGVNGVTVKSNTEKAPGAGGHLLSFTDGGAGRVNKNVVISDNVAASDDTILLGYIEGLKSSNNFFNVNTTGTVELRSVTGLRSSQDSFITLGTYALYYNGGSDNKITNGTISNEDSASNFSTLRSYAGDAIELVECDIIKGTGGTAYDAINTGVTPIFTATKINGIKTTTPQAVGGRKATGLTKTVVVDNADVTFTFDSSVSWRPATLRLTVSSCNNSGLYSATGEFVITLKHQGTTNMNAIVTNTVFNNGLTVSASSSNNVLTVNLLNTLGSDVTFTVGVVVMADVDVSID